ncbi:unnamed protein product [Alternaria burnsii]|nr:unnamed protein product [Alternaria burnsii]
MATSTSTATFTKSNDPTAQHGYPREPLKSKGVLNAYKSFEVTPVIGREFVDVSLKEWLRAPNSDELIRDLAITISQRGVVYFRKQDDLTDELQKELAQRLGELSGKPETSKLHIHPVRNAGNRLGGNDNEISVISSDLAKQLFKERSQSGKSGWHSDITFEPVPSDYAILRMTQLPKSGGDTLWASGYDLYDRLSKPYQKFFESLTATYAQPDFNRAAKENNFPVYTAARGAPENTGDSLSAVHPCVRTNPVTGWKSLYSVGHHVQRINELSAEESKRTIDWFLQLITENHDLQIRHRWQNPNDVAIWDNRSVLHTATYDTDGQGPRKGFRVVSLGERPYLDPQSMSRLEALRLEEGQ